MFVICSNSSIHNSRWKSLSRTVSSRRAASCSARSALVTGLIHLSEKYLIETLRNECKKYVYSWLHDLEMTNLDEKKDFVPRHILYKDGTRKHIAAEIGNSMDSEKGALFIIQSLLFHLMTALLSSHTIVCVQSDLNNHLLFRYIMRMVSWIFITWWKSRFIDSQSIETCLHRWSRTQRDLLSANRSRKESHLQDAQRVSGTTKHRREESTWHITRPDSS